MADVFISHVLEDRAACERLVSALEELGLDVTLELTSTRESELKDRNASMDEHANAMIVLWSNDAIQSEAILSDARRAHATPRRGGDASQHRYCGVVLDDTPGAELPAPFNGMDVVPFSGLLTADRAFDFDGPEFIRLLSTLEALTDRRTLVQSAKRAAKRSAALADARSTVDRLTIQAASLERRLAALETQNSAVSDALAAEAARCTKFESDLAGVTAQYGTELVRSAELARTTDELRAALAEQTERADALDRARQDLSAQLTQSQENALTLTAELDSTRLKLTAGMRQQATLQAQVDAGDQIIRQIMGQREELLSVRERLDGDVARLTRDMSAATARALDSDSRSMTYETALLDRQQELTTLGDRLSAAQSELAIVKPQAEALGATVQAWGHVPWRLIAAGSLAAGALITYGVAMMGQALDV